MKRTLTAKDLASRALRVSSYVLAITLGLGALSARKAHADAKNAASLVGEQLLRLAETEEGAPHELSINGQTVRVTSAHTSMPLAEVLARFEKSCDEHADGMVKDLADLERSFGRAPTAEGHPGIGMLRDDRDGRGVVACFAAGASVGTAELGARLERFTRSYDLADLGDLRYVAARTLESGTTEVVASWTEGRFRLGEMFPATGDAAGEDPYAAPRPEMSRRVLSARDARAPYGVFVYEVAGDPAAALGAFGALARKSGFVMNDAVSERDASVIAFERPGVDVVVTSEAHERGLSTLSIVEMPVGSARKDTR